MTEVDLQPEWIAVDWGTSALRCWAMRGEAALARASSDQGMGRLSPDAYEPTLLELIEPWLAADRVCPVLAAGMVGARQGWVEAPYRSVPCAPVEVGSAIAVPTKDPRIDVRILPGLSQTEPADVMRGEEAQIAGVLSRFSGFDGVVCLPGTHTKWVSVKDGQVEHFHTMMTGEMFDLLATRSVLRHSLAGEGADLAAFAEGLRLAQGQDMPLHLFALRAESLLKKTDPVALRSRLSGLLIGQELAATRPFCRGRDIVVVASTGLESLYLAALERSGAQIHTLPASEATLAGLCLAHKKR